MWNFLFDAIAHFFGISTDDLGYFTLEEIKQMLRTGMAQTEKLALRKEHGCILTTGAEERKVVVIDTDERRFIWYQNLIRKIEDTERKSVISGIVGQRGRAKGRVIVVRHYKDVFKVREGDILVANTTHPNYLMGMKKAAAFITDEGGIACHAAIVARELHKPCIVGTRVATKMLKEGDEVEVDAEKRTVVRI